MALGAVVDCGEGCFYFDAWCAITMITIELCGAGRVWALAREVVGAPTVLANDIVGRGRG